MMKAAARQPPELDRSAGRSLKSRAPSTVSSKSGVSAWESEIAMGGNSDSAVDSESPDVMYDILFLALHYQLSSMNWSEQVATATTHSFNLACGFCFDLCLSTLPSFFAQNFFSSGVSDGQFACGSHMIIRGFIFLFSVFWAVAHWILKCGEVIIIRPNLSLKPIW